MMAAKASNVSDVDSRPQYFVKNVKYIYVLLPAKTIEIALHYSTNLLKIKKKEHKLIN